MFSTAFTIAHDRKDAIRCERSAAIHQWRCQKGAEGGRTREGEGAGFDVFDGGAEQAAGFDGGGLSRPPRFLRPRTTHDACVLGEQLL